MRNLILCSLMVFGFLGTTTYVQAGSATGNVIGGGLIGCVAGEVLLGECGGGALAGMLIGAAKHDSEEGQYRYKRVRGPGIMHTFTPPRGTARIQYKDRMTNNVMCRYYTFTKRSGSVEKKVACMRGGRLVFNNAATGSVTTRNNAMINDDVFTDEELKTTVSTDFDTDEREGKDYGRRTSASKN